MDLIEFTVPKLYNFLYVPKIAKMYVVDLKYS
jgi:hypothetical protein